MNSPALDKIQSLFDWQPKRLPITAGLCADGPVLLQTEEASILCHIL